MAPVRIVPALQPLKDGHDGTQAYTVLADSNLDWGQNAWYVERYRDTHPGLIVEPDGKDSTMAWRYLSAMLIGYARVSTDDQDTAARGAAGERIRGG